LDGESKGQAIIVLIMMVECDNSWVHLSDLSGVTENLVIEEKIFD
jgi:hypothetical protein